MDGGRPPPPLNQEHLIGESVGSSASGKSSANFGEVLAHVDRMRQTTSAELRGLQLCEAKIQKNQQDLRNVWRSVQNLETGDETHELEE